MISFITCKHNINDKYSNDNYHNDVKKISYLLLVCPKCKTVGLFHRHAVYSRYLFNSTEEYITIQRVRCESCGSTHALLPDIIIPYRYFSSPFILRLFDLYLKKHLSVSQIACALGISHQAVEALVDSYKQYHEERMKMINHDFSKILDQDFMIDYFHMFFLFIMQRIPKRFFHGILFFLDICLDSLLPVPLEKKQPHHQDQFLFPNPVAKITEMRYNYFHN